MSKAAELAALIGSGQAQENKNLIINGGMAVSQRGTSFADPSDDNYSLDRMHIFNNNDGATTITQDTTVPSGEGFYYSLKLDCTGTDGTIAAGQYLTLSQRIEGFNNNVLEYGTSSAKTVVISFYAKSNLTGTFCYSVRNSAANRSFIKEFSLASANTWERISFTIPGDTSGTWLATNGIGSNHQISFSMGSTYHGTANQWNASNVVATSNIANFLSSTDNEFFITGWQVEVGTGAPTAFVHEDIGATFRKCQRYYYRLGESSAYARYMVGQCDSANNCNGVVELPVEMRDTPTIEHTGTASNYAVYEAGTVHTCSAVPSINALGSDKNIANLISYSTGNFAAGNSGELISNNNANAYIGFKSEI